MTEDEKTLEDIAWRIEQVFKAAGVEVCGYGTFIVRFPDQEYSQTVTLQLDNRERAPLRMVA